MDINNVNEAMGAEVESIVDDGLVREDIPSLVCMLVHCSRTALSCYATSPTKYVISHFIHAAGHISTTFTKFIITIPPMPPARPRKPRTLADWVLHFDNQMSNITTYQTGQAHGQTIQAISSLYIDLLTACDAHGLQPRARNPNRG